MLFQFGLGYSGALAALVTWQVLLFVIDGVLIGWHRAREAAEAEPEKLRGWGDWYHERAAEAESRRRNIEAGMREDFR